MNGYGVVLETGTVRFERLLPGPIERVWEYLTDSDKRGKWLSTGKMDLRDGGKVEHIFRNTELSADKNTPEKYRQYEGKCMAGRILRCEPPRLLSYTWNESRPGEPSEVTFELSSRGKEVLLVLTHRRLPDDGSMLNVSGGWHTHLGILEDQLNGQEPRPFWATHAKMEAEYARRFAAG